jgi:hypothetical protein
MAMRHWSHVRLAKCLGSNHGKALLLSLAWRWAVMPAGVAVAADMLYDGTQCLVSNFDNSMW